MGTCKIIIPTYNAGIKFQKILEMLLKQEGVTKGDIFVIDSSSEDDTIAIAKDFAIEVKTIPKQNFGHGKTRTYAAKKFADKDILVFMTQDALPCDSNSVMTLCDYLLADESMAAAYGRQLPHADTDIFGKHARLFNYPAQSSIKSLSDRDKYGIKTAFLSDSFAVYRTAKLKEIGWFPDVKFGEDTCAAGRLLLAGYKIGYCAEAKVCHSHSYSFAQEWGRSRMIGRFHKEQPWLLESFGKPEGEGLRMVWDQMNYLISHGLWYRIPEAILRDVVKFVGYKVGQVW